METIVDSKSIKRQPLAERSITEVHSLLIRQKFRKIWKTKFEVEISQMFEEGKTPESHGILCTSRSLRI